jgi:hypothetical protein
MGAFYTHLTVKSSDAKKVASAISYLNHRAAVAGPWNGLVVVVTPQNEHWDEAIADFAQTLSELLNTATWAVMVHDSDVLYYWLYDRGAEIDRYNSCPWYFDDDTETPQGGDAEVLASLLGKPEAAQRLDEILRADAEPADERTYLFEEERHADLAECLGLPRRVTTYGFQDLATDYLPEGVRAEQVYLTEGSLPEDA